MDPVTALSVAAAAVQFVQFGLVVAAEIKELYESSDGCLTKHTELEKRSKTLERLVRGLSISDRAKNDQAISELGSKCAATATELQAIIKSIRKNTTGSKVSQTLKVYLRTIRSSKKIDKLDHALEDYRRQLETTILVDLRERLDSLALEQEGSLKHLRQDHQKILNLIAQGHTNIADLVSQEHQQTRELVIREAARTRSTTTAHAESTSDKIGQEHNRSRHEVHSHLDRLEQNLTVEARQSQVVKSIFYPDYMKREEEVTEAHYNTFRWIFDEEPEPDIAWSDFATWLRTGEHIYWINGKAGSGKSTLMSFLVQHEQTGVELDTWAGGDPFLTPSFFFWRSGNEMQKSILGLLRSLLYQILKEHPHLHSIIPSLSRAESAIPAWTSRKLISALCAVVEKFAGKICFFIDGLDEFEGDAAARDGLVQLVLRLAATSKVKLCISSRPENHLVNAFGLCDKLRLQDLNYFDIKTFIKDRLKDIDELSGFTGIIATRAEGIFLWVTLVTDALKRAHKEGDTENQLVQRFAAIPSGLFQLYEHMLNAIDPIRRSEAGLYFNMTDILTKARAQHASMLAIFTLGLDPATKDKIEQQQMGMSRQTLNDLCRQKYDRIIVCSQGLLECSRVSLSDGDVVAEDLYFDKDMKINVQFIHRTARDFVFDSTHNHGNSISDSRISSEAMTACLYGQVAALMLLLADENIKDFKPAPQYCLQGILHTIFDADDTSLVTEILDMCRDTFLRRHDICESIVPDFFEDEEFWETSILHDPSYPEANFYAFVQEFGFYDYVGEKIAEERVQKDPVLIARMISLALCDRFDRRLEDPGAPFWFSRSALVCAALRHVQAHVESDQTTASNDRQKLMLYDIDKAWMKLCMLCVSPYGLFHRSFDMCHLPTTYDDIAPLEERRKVLEPMIDEFCRLPVYKDFKIQLSCQTEYNYGSMSYVQVWFAGLEGSFRDFAITIPCKMLLEDVVQHEIPALQPSANNHTLALIIGASDGTLRHSHEFTTEESSSVILILRRLVSQMYPDNDMLFEGNYDFRITVEDILSIMVGVFLEQSERSDRTMSILSFLHWWLSCIEESAPPTLDPMEVRGLSNATMTRDEVYDYKRRIEDIVPLEVLRDLNPIWK